MVDDLIKRLRVCEVMDDPNLPDEAADLIESQARRIGELENALRDVFYLIEDGWLVRYTGHDHTEGWAMKQLPYVQRLAAAKHALSAERASP
jgi:hypothetical protein